jgi:hypothetical protein
LFTHPRYQLDNKKKGGKRRFRRVLVGLGNVCLVIGLRKIGGGAQ